MLNPALMTPGDVASIVVAAGALGTAAMGIVEATKYFGAVGEAGYGQITTGLAGLLPLLQEAYGGSYDRLLRAQYRGSDKELARLLRQGVRVGLKSSNAEAAAATLSSINGKALADAIAIAAGEKPPTPPAPGAPPPATPPAASGQWGRLNDAERAIIARFEVAADARIDAALTLSHADYEASLRILASFVAVIIGIGVAALMQVSAWDGLALGLVAVPLAPMAKDVADGIQAAATALKKKA